MAPGLNELLNLATLVSVAARIAGRQSLSEEELRVAERHESQVSDELLRLTVEAIAGGRDPLGTAYCVIRSPEERRDAGQTFTPIEAVLGMYAWAEARGPIARIVDPGAGSGRYILTGLRRHSNAIGVASEMDPLVALLLRANAHALGVHDRLDIRLGDFRELELVPIGGRTLFIGNPPYVRHHDIEPHWKSWYSDRLSALGHASSKLAGLHLHFFVKTLELARPGDLGCFITAAEWLSVDYGQAMRDLMTNGLGGRAVFVVSPEVHVFGDALVTACIACFEPGVEGGHIEFKTIERVEDLLELGGGRPAERTRARAERNWTLLVRDRKVARPEGFIELGSLFRVSRGQVTGKNAVWVTDRNRFGLPAKFLVPSITDAADIIEAPNAIIADTGHLRWVIDLPADLSALTAAQRRAVNEFLDWARSLEADKGFIAEHRKPWWRVGMKPAPQIVVTYMGRRPPVFAVNRAGASLINVAHGLYAKFELDEELTRRLVAWLNRNVARESGRSS